jgi:predicted outer membrane protein
MTRRLEAVAAIAALLAAGPILAKDKNKPPDLHTFTLAVEARWGAGPGPEAFRADVERALAATASRGCVAEVTAGADAVHGGASDLVLIATLEGFVEEVRFDDSLATAVTPGEPTQELRRVAISDLDNTLQLSVRDGAREVASKSFHADVHYRPMYVGENPQETARQRLIERISDETKKLLCKTDGKLAARVREESSAR